MFWIFFGEIIDSTHQFEVVFFLLCLFVAIGFCLIGSDFKLWQQKLTLVCVLTSSLTWYEDSSVFTTPRQTFKYYFFTALSLYRPTMTFQYCFESRVIEVEIYAWLWSWMKWFQCSVVFYLLIGSLCWSMWKWFHSSFVAQCHHFLDLSKHSQHLALLLFLIGQYVLGSIYRFSAASHFNVFFSWRYYQSVVLCEWLVSSVHLEIVHQFFYLSFLGFSQQIYWYLCRLFHDHSYLTLADFDWNVK